jgi:hypothetical protein
MHDALFEVRRKLVTEDLRRHAEGVDLDLMKFERDMEEHAYDDPAEKI